MSIASILPLILLVVVMFVMTRSAKKKQAAAQNMRNEMQAGVGVRTIGGMYATVVSVTDDAVLLEVAPGVHATYAKNAVNTVLSDEEFQRITGGALGLPEGFTTDDIPEDASELDEYEYDYEDAEDGEGESEDGEKSDKVDMTKSEDAEEEETEEDESEDESAEVADEAEEQVEDEEPAKAEASAKSAKSDKKAAKADLRKDGGK